MFSIILNQLVIQSNSAYKGMMHRVFPNLGTELGKIILFIHGLHLG
jgi:hypothetical protein